MSTVFTASSPRGCLFADVAVGGGKHADSSTSFVEKVVVVDFGCGEDGG